MSHHVRERFPNQRLLVGQLYESDHEFRSLCHDYGVCVEELRKATEAKHGQDIAQRTEQLRELQTELETEIVEYLDLHRAMAH